MPKFARVTFSDEHLDLAGISQTYGDIDASVRDYFLGARATSADRFTGLTRDEVEREMFALLSEHERSVSLSILAALEAAFRVDYLQRCYRKKKDELSQAFRKIYADKGPRASLEDDILQS